MKLLFILFFASYLHAGQVQDLLGSEMVEVLQAPDLVYFEDTPKDLLTRKQVTDLKQLLLDDKSYFLDYKKKCLFFPEKKVTFQKGEKLELFFNFSCNQVEFSYQGKKVLLDIDPAQKELKKVFE